MSRETLMDRAADAGGVVTAGSLFASWQLADAIAATVASSVAVIVGLVTIWFYVTRRLEEVADRRTRLAREQHDRDSTERES